MPTIPEVENKTKELAQWIRPTCNSATFEWWIAEFFHNPSDYGIPRNWTYDYAFNFTRNDVRALVARELWNLPNHPDKFPACYAHLPWRFKEAISRGWFKTLWPDAPSKKAIHEWLLTCDRLITNKMSRHIGYKWLNDPELYYIRSITRITGDYVPRSMLIANWLLAKQDWAGWNRRFEYGYGPNGAMRSISPKDLLDEIWDRDLVNGARTKPDTVFRSVLARSSDDRLDQLYKRNLPFKAMPWSEKYGVRQIKDERSLVSEASRLSNCAAGYADECRDGSCYIVVVGNSMAELSPSGKIYQHLSYHNQDPSRKDKDALSKWYYECMPLTYQAVNCGAVKHWVADIAIAANNQIRR